jgi:hypothetical protein
MPILRERVGWRRPKAVHGPDLTQAEQGNARAALRVLKRRAGSWPELATLVGLRVGTAQSALKPNGSVSAGVALRIARAAGVPLETVLSGAWPAPNACPHCGQPLPSRDHA